MLKPIEPERRLTRIRSLSTPELLDRVTVLRDYMDADALHVLHAELAGRGIGPDEIGEHLRVMKIKVIQHRDGMPAQCSRCHRVAVISRTDWHRIWGYLPLFRRVFYYCDDHR
jgi:hypothetical protein